MNQYEWLRVGLALHLIEHIAIFPRIATLLACQHSIELSRHRFRHLIINSKRPQSTTNNQACGKHLFDKAHVTTLLLPSCFTIYQHYNVYTRPLYSLYSLLTTLYVTEMPISRCPSYCIENRHMR